MAAFPSVQRQNPDQGAVLVLDSRPYAGVAISYPQRKAPRGLTDEPVPHVLCFMSHQAVSDLRRDYVAAE